jgi:hypothetical protein
MAKNYKDFSYFETRPDIIRIFDDLEAFHDFCRLELRDFNPAELYKKDAPNYGAYLASKRPRWSRGDQTRNGPSRSGGASRNGQTRNTSR